MTVEIAIATCETTLRGERLLEKLTTFTPKMRSTINLVLSEQQRREIRTNTSKDQSVELVLDTLRFLYPAARGHLEKAMAPIRDLAPAPDRQKSGGQRQRGAGAMSAYAVTQGGSQGADLDGHADRGSTCSGVDVSEQVAAEIDDVFKVVDSVETKSSVAEAKTALSAAAERLKGITLGRGFHTSGVRPLSKARPKKSSGRAGSGRGKGKGKGKGSRRSRPRMRPKPGETWDDLKKVTKC